MQDPCGPLACEKPKTAARRRQILEAATLCFCARGFHATSMAEISAEAGMSVGHIYRYFTGKEEIIAAIVRADVEKVRAKVSALKLDDPDLPRTLMEGAEDAVMQAFDPDQAALMLEIKAEAARNPAIGKWVREADVEISKQLRTMIGAAVKHKLSKAELDARVEMFQLIFQGVGLRTVINPALNRSALSQLVKLSIEAILK